VSCRREKRKKRIPVNITYVLNFLIIVGTYLTVYYEKKEEIIIKKLLAVRIFGIEAPLLKEIICIVLVAVKYYYYTSFPKMRSFVE